MDDEELRALLEKAQDSGSRKEAIQASQKWTSEIEPNVPYFHIFCQLQPPFWNWRGPPLQSLPRVKPRQELTLMTVWAWICFTTSCATKTPTELEKCAIANIDSTVRFEMAPRSMLSTFANCKIILQYAAFVSFRREAQFACIDYRWFCSMQRYVAVAFGSFPGDWISQITGHGNVNRDSSSPCPRFHFGGFSIKLHKVRVQRAQQSRWSPENWLQSISSTKPRKVPFCEADLADLGTAVELLELLEGSFEVGWVQWSMPFGPCGSFQQVWAMKPGSSKLLPWFQLAGRKPPPVPVLSWCARGLTVS